MVFGFASIKEVQRLKSSVVKLFWATTSPLSITVNSFMLCRLSISYIVYAVLCNFDCIQALTYYYTHCLLLVKCIFIVLHTVHILATYPQNSQHSNQKKSPACNS